MTDAILEDLPYDELRDRAFAVAEHRRDLGFFVDLLGHTSAAQATADEGGSLGEIGGTISETIAAARRSSAARALATSSRCSGPASRRTSASTPPPDPPSRARPVSCPVVRAWRTYGAYRAPWSATRCARVGWRTCSGYSAT